MTSMILIKVTGVILYIVILGLSIFVTLTNAAFMGIKESNNWAFSYISTNILDIFFF